MNMLHKFSSLLIVSFLTVLAVTAQPKREVSYTPSGVLITDGIKLHDEAKYKEAIEKYKQVNPNDTAYALALYEMALSYIGDSSSSKAIDACTEGLGLSSKYTGDFYELLGNAYDQAKMFDKAIGAYTDGLKRYPYNYKFYFEMGITYANHGNDTAAARCFKESIRLNPLHGTSHYQLGSLAIRNNKFSQGILSYMMYLLIQPAGTYSFDALTTLEKLNKGEYQVDKSKVVDISGSADHFEVTEEIIRSKIALDEKYKSKVKLTYYNLTKPLQAFMEKLEYDKGDKGFWMQTYVPLFTELWKKDYFEPMMYLICSSINDPKVQSAIKSKKSDIDKMVKWAGESITNERRSREMMLDGKLQKVSVSYYENNRIEGYGLRDNSGEKNIGYWKFIYSNGETKSEGKFNSNGNYDGLWKVYSMDGKLLKTITYKDGKKDGEFVMYHENGKIEEKGKYQNDELEGLATGYHYNGNKAFELNFVKGVRDGKMMYYHENGNKEKEYVEKNGIYIGEYKEFHRYGTPRLQVNLVNGKIEGKFKRFFIDGTLNSETSYVNDKQDGPYKLYNVYGKVSKEGMNKNGKAEGEWKSYYDDGTLEEVQIYSNGELNGVQKNYDEDGKLCYEFDNSKGNIKSYRYFNKEGKIISEAKEKKGRLDFVTYYADGIHKGSEGASVDGKLSGKWIFYYDNGKVKTETNYENGDKNGEEKTYYENGLLKSVKTYKDGEGNGYYCSYYKNGNKNVELWFESDLGTGPRNQYYPDGTLSDQKFLMEDKTTGTQISFDEKGRKDFDYVLFEDDLDRVNGYDTLGNNLFSFDLKDSVQPYTILSLNKKVIQQGTYLNGNKNGQLKYFYTSGKVRKEESYDHGFLSGKTAYYFEDGKKSTESFYKYDQLDSLYLNYYENGKPRQRFTYLFDDAQGPAFYFHDNGRVSIAANYKNDVRHGKCYFYSNDSTLKMLANYRYGQIVSYSYLGKDGKMVPEIKIVDGTGKITAYYQNGNKSMEIELKSNFYEGVVKHYYPDGKEESSQQYKNDDLNGEVKKYFASGKLRADEQWKDDELNGLCKYYNENGKLEKEVNYINGIKYGPATIYDTVTGKVKQKLNYYSNQLL